MAHRYEELDRVYDAHPEIKALVAAAVDVVKAHHEPRGQFGQHLGPYLDSAVKRLAERGQAVDNRDWLK